MRRVDVGGMAGVTMIRWANAHAQSQATDGQPAQSTAPAANAGASTAEQNAQALGFHF
jgi:hypothetical protein